MRPIRPRFRLPLLQFMNSPNPTAPVARNYRWVICGLLFFATTFNYLDRRVISYWKEFFCTPAPQGGFGWSNTDFDHSSRAFTPA